MQIFRLLALGLTLALFMPCRSGAHDLELTETLLVLKTDGTFQVDLLCDLDALALGANPSTDSAELAAALLAMGEGERSAAEARLFRLFERRVRVLFDGERVPVEISFPQYGTPLASEAEIPSVYGLVARLEGWIPSTAAAVSFRASRAFPPVHLTILHQGRVGGSRELLEQGGESVPFLLDAEAPTPTVDRWQVAGQYLVLGFWHIVPEGLDHILFVLGLFLLSARFRPLLFQVTAFTAAHAVTLTLATLGWVSLEASIVEPLIALSIVWVAVENVASDQLRAWRPALVFVFGLLHGLGFAGVLGELGLPDGERTAALVSFNLGIELGQLVVLATALLLVGWARERSWYRSRVTVPISCLIAAVGLYWTIERLL